MDEYLRRAARLRPDRTALIDAESGDSWTYEQLDGWASRIGTRLVEQGATAGDRVGLLLPRSPVAIAAIWGGFRAGATLVPLNPAEPASEIRSRCERAGVKTCLTASDGEAGFEAGSLADFRPIRLDDQTGQGPPAAREGKDTHFSTRRDIDRTRVVLFTSGTTGEPTGVRLTGRNLGASAASTVERVGATRTDRWLLDLPIYHAGGLSIPIRTAMLGATTVVRSAFDAAETGRTMAAFDVTGVSLVPTMLERLLDGPGLTAGLRFALVGGAATPPSLVRRALDAAVPIFASYGMTETASGIATATPRELEADPKTVGRPVRAATISIRGEEDSPVDARTVGEITVSGPIVSPGSIDGTERSPDEPLRTGDRGYLTAAERLFVTGRIDDLIVTGGENVSPREVEAAIRELEDVAAVAVLGLDDPEWGERVAAAIVPTTGEPEASMTLESIRDRLQDRLAGYKLPKTVRVVEALPRTASGTVDREALRDQFRDSGGRFRERGGRFQ